MRGKRKSMKKRHFAAIAATAAGLCFAFIGQSYADSGWLQKDGGAWVWQKENGELLTEDWRRSKGAWFYLGEDGTMQKNRLIRYRNDLYYLDENGAMSANRWLYVTAELGAETGSEEGWYYFLESGKAFSRKGNGFRRLIGDRYYAFDDTGRMLTGFLDADGNEIEGETASAFAAASYYAAPDGALYTDQWLDYRTTSDETFEGSNELESALAGKNYSDYDQIWLYFDANSKKVFAKPGDDGDLRIATRTIDGKKYGFDENGVMLTTFTTEGGLTNAGSVDQSVIGTEKPVYWFSGNDGGAAQTNTWVYMYPPEYLNAEDYDEQKPSWWYIGAAGKAYQDGIKRINGRDYAFDRIGRMQAGFVLFSDPKKALEIEGIPQDGKSHFVTRYNLEDWSSRDFIEGNLFGIDRCKLYFFGPDAQSDGSMKTGSDVEIQLSDGVFSFGFSPSGIAYGNQNTLAKRDGAYYINGLRLEGSEDDRYGVVKDASDRYFVVDQNGKVMTGSRRAVEDGNGGWLLIINGRFAARVETTERPRWATVNGIEGFYEYDRELDTKGHLGALLAGKGDEPDTGGLADGQALNF